ADADGELALQKAVRAEEADQTEAERDVVGRVAREAEGLDVGRHRHAESPDLQHPREARGDGGVGASAHRAAVFDVVRLEERGRVERSGDVVVDVPQAEGLAHRGRTGVRVRAFDAFRVAAVRASETRHAVRREDRTLDVLDVVVAGLERIGRRGPYEGCERCPNKKRTSGSTSIFAVVIKPSSKRFPNFASSRSCAMRSRWSSIRASFALSFAFDASACIASSWRKASSKLSTAKLIS